MFIQQIKVFLWLKKFEGSIQTCLNFLSPNSFTRFLLSIFFSFCISGQTTVICSGMSCEKLQGHILGFLGPNLAQNFVLSSQLDIDSYNMSDVHTFWFLITYWICRGFSLTNHTPITNKTRPQHRVPIVPKFGFQFIFVDIDSILHLSECTLTANLISVGPIQIIFVSAPIISVPFFHTNQFLDKGIYLVEKIVAIHF